MVEFDTLFDVSTRIIAHPHCPKERGEGGGVRVGHLWFVNR